MPKVLVVEDDEAMAAALREGFQYEGHVVEIARDGIQGLRLATEWRPDLIILDVMLPRMSGLDVCKRIRADKNGVPIILLTARGQEIDKVVGLKSGADDYVTKPFSFMELLARAEAVLRRSGGASAQPEACRFGDVEIDFVRLQATKGGRPLEMSPREYRLLGYFVSRTRQVVSREELLSAVWGYDKSSMSRTVDTHVAKLRKKVEDSPENPRYILTIHGAGYKFTG